MDLEAQTAPSPATGLHSHSHHGHEASPVGPSVVAPSDFLRPRAVSRPITPAAVAPPPPKPEKPIDRDEREALASIREFLKLRTCYDVLPLSFRLINLDTSLTVQESLNILVMNGIDQAREVQSNWDADIENAGIVSAPLWDSKTSTFAGLLTVTDYLNVVQYYNKNTDRLKDVEKLQLSDLRGKDAYLASPFAPLTNFPLGVERHIGVNPPETISTSPTGQLYNALTKMLVSRARRIPLISYDDQTQRANVTSVITQYRILKFIALNVVGTERLRKPLSLLKLGTSKDICRCSMETPVLDVIQEMVDRNISSVPVVTTDNILLNVFEAVDVINLLSSNDYSNLSWSVGRALLERNPSHPGIYTCTPEDGLDTIFETIRKSRVHRLVIVEEGNELKGVLSLSDILHYILIDGDDGTGTHP